MDDPIIPKPLPEIEPLQWEGIVYRHMFGSFPPERENTRGARWNPPEVPAIYTSVQRSAAIAEAEFQISLQPFRPKAKRTVYRISVKLESVIDLTPPGVLRRLGLSESALSEIDHSACRAIGHAVEWMGNDGILVPCARASGTNLVIFPNRVRPDAFEFEVLEAEVIEESRLPGAE